MKAGIRKLIDIVQEDIIGTDNRFIAIAWTVCLTTLVGLGFYLSSESMSFLGVAGSREQQINFEYPVEIKQVHVIPGQTVSQGDLLIELDQSALAEKIRVARATLAKTQAEFGVRRTLNRLVRNDVEQAFADPLGVEIEDLKHELEYLERQRKNLFVFSDIDGIVGGVSVKKGERVPSFSSLVTLSPRHPSYVEGFLHENLPTKIAVGREVTVTSVSSRQSTIQGKVVAVGARIVSMPARLSVYPGMQVYGREVVVEIPIDNPFLLGEKVQIKPKLDFAQFFRDLWPIDKAQARERRVAGLNGPALTHEPAAIKMPPELARQFKLEPSGAIFLKDMNKFLVVSDDTDKAKSATLFLVDADGLVAKETLTVPGAGKIDDMESISQQGSMIYVLASQGLKKSGKDKPERNMFLRFKRIGLEISEVQSIEFKPMLLKAIQSSTDKKLLAAFKDLDAGDIEIESHFVDGADLFLGFKNPMDGDLRSLILTIRDFESIFKSKTLGPNQLAVSQWIDFGKGEGSPHRLSDLVRIGDSLYASTVCANESCGAIWKIAKADRTLDRVIAEQIKFYSALRPEGLAYDTKAASLFVTFDQQKEGPMYNRLALPGD